VAYVLYANLVDGDIAVVGAALHVGYGFDVIQHRGLLCAAYPFRRTVKAFHDM
jgi:hypothetical protein